VVDGARLLFGLPEMRVEHVERLSDGTRVAHVVTDDPAAAACPSCAVVSTSRKGSAVTCPATSLAVRTELSCGGTRVAGDAGKTTANAARSSRPSSRCRRGRSVGGRGRRGPRRVVADRAPRVRRARLDATGRAATHSDARHRRDPPRKAPLAALRRDRPVGANRPVGHRVRRPER
jgi:hypothetical protein